MTVKCMSSLDHGSGHIWAWPRAGHRSRAPASNLGFPHCRQIFYHLSHQRNPLSLKLMDKSKEIGYKVKLNPRQRKYRRGTWRRETRTTCKLRKGLEQQGKSLSHWEGLI